ncbi:hypothetical protein LP52_03850 [Streptomonospora alba]|uniref:Uncharacterized protein n=1 Tax=Streptomonospora alba TaxID=183763 RepID=A0A0C2JTB5_9ACTN|nr:hypothetical protein [Streptomonospora alba]KII00073.1 hypothetical protein LP52_03850 [Streptomonospora alba]
MAQPESHRCRSARSTVHLALEPPRWALDYYLRHLVLIAGISLVPAAQRFTVSLYGEAFALPAHIALETLAEGARVVLVVLLVRMAVLADDEVRRTRHLGALNRIRAFAERGWPSLLLQAGFLLALAAVFNVVPERIVPRWLPPSAEDLYWAALLAGKNVTVIAFTLVWMVGAARQLLIEGGRLLEEDGAPHTARPLRE